MRSLAWIACCVAAAVTTLVGQLHADTKTYALIVSSNHGSSTDRPDLRYADDDGARYYRLFDSLQSPHQTILLTTFDRSTAQQHPELVQVARPPRRAELQAAIDNVRTSIAEAKRQGHRTAFYFIFAGHGDVENGKGHLELEDGRIDADYLEHQIVDRVGSDVQHIVLDSCNSFFVLNPRRPGGKRWATPADMTQGFGQRHPNVGVLLSTNAESEVFEWSELESGIFSHEVRSGLSGAADVNGDGEISYTELAGFIETANLRIPRETFRPHVFYWGPGGAHNTSLFPSGQVRGRQIALSNDSQRVWIRGPSGERLLDAYKEPGTLSLIVPGHLDSPLYAFVRVNQAARPEIREYKLPPDQGKLSLASSSPQQPAEAGRGIDGVFRNLFALPYGPSAYRLFLQTKVTSDPEVIGVSRQDQQRARHYIDAISETGRTERLMKGALFGTGSAVMAGAAAATYFSDRRNQDNQISGLVFGGLSLVYLAGAVHFFASDSEEESLKMEFDYRSRTDANWRNTVVEMDRKLEKLAEKRKAWRRTGIWVGGAMTAALAGFGIVQIAKANDADTKEEREDRRLGGVVLTTLSVGVGATLLAVTSRETPTERLIRLYRNDPGLKVSVQPASVGLGAGMGLTMTGQF